LIFLSCFSNMDVHLSSAFWSWMIECVETLAFHLSTKDCTLSGDITPTSDALASCHRWGGLPRWSRVHLDQWHGCRPSSFADGVCLNFSYFLSLMTQCMNLKSFPELFARYKSCARSN
jgi:hypothetical protein